MWLNTVCTYLLLSETISKKVDKKPSWLWDILICSFSWFLKGVTATTSSCSHHTVFCGDVDICKVFSSYLIKTERLHLHLDGFFIVTIQSSFSISHCWKTNKKQVPTWIMQPAARHIPIILVLAIDSATFWIEKWLHFCFSLKRRTAKVYDYM